MDFDFYKNFERIGSVKLGEALSEKFIVSQAFQKLELSELKFPEGHEDEGEIAEVRLLGSMRYELARDIGQMICEECDKIIYSINLKKVTNLESPSNPEVLSSLLSMVLQSTSFVMG